MTLAPLESLNLRSDLPLKHFEEPNEKVKE